MSDTVIALIVVAAVFLIIALVIAFRFDSVKNSFQGPGGVKFDISGSRRQSRRNNRESQESDQSKETVHSGGTASISIGGQVDASNLTANAASGGRIEVRKDVNDSDLLVRGGESADVDIKGGVKNSDINTENPDAAKKGG